MSRSNKAMSRYRLYVGNISHRSHPRDVEDLFREYGELVDFDFKDRGQQVNFCFVEFKSSRDAEDAMYELNGHRLLGVPIIVEPARERRSKRNFGGPPPSHHENHRRDRGGGHGHDRNGHGHNGHSADHYKLRLDAKEKILANNDYFIKKVSVDMA